jgi:hypothetical protein
MSRTSVGRDFISDAMFKTATQPNPAIIMALADVADTPPAQGSNTRTQMGGNTTTEATADGFARSTSTYAHTTAAQTSTLQHTFTNTAAAGANAHTITAVAIFSPTSAGVPGAANTGTMVFETTEPNPPTLTGTDSVNQTVSIDFGV